MNTKLFEPFTLGRFKLSNRIVMAPMTRSRASDGVPTPMMATYYSQRAAAGLIITEGVSPSPNGLGYARIPGLYQQDQFAGWRQVTAAVHAKGGKIFMQMMHTGRVSHAANMPKGVTILAPSAIGLTGKMWTDTMGQQAYPVPKEMTLMDIQKTIKEYATSAEMAIEAGFDGVELHAANGYLMDQFLNPASNQRTDRYGGSAENRMRFTLEATEAVIAKIGPERTGIRVSPYGAFNDMKPFDGIDQFYGDLAKELSFLGLIYIHVVDHSSMGTPPVSPEVKAMIRKNFAGAYILSGGYDAERAEKDLVDLKGDLVSFGRPFIANPDLVEKLRHHTPLVPADPAKFYTPGEEGYLV